jgi:hypothetical protein
MFMDSKVPAWHRQAACAGMSDYFDYDPDTCPVTVDAALTATLRKICGACPVKEECLQDAINESDWQCFRAGLTPKEIRMLFVKLNVPTRHARGAYHPMSMQNRDQSFDA